MVVTPYESSAAGSYSEHRYWRADLEVFGGWPCLLTDPSLWAVLTYRFGRWARHRGNVARSAYRVIYAIVRLVTGVDLPVQAQIGPGLRIFHFGGIFINPNTRIGARCRMRQGVTTGVRVRGGPSPTIGDDVLIGSYAQILGGVTIGDRAAIGSLSVVLDDVPADGKAVGTKARILPSEAASAVDADARQ
jgi:serine O-acetyltransferase